MNTSKKFSLAGLVRSLMLQKPRDQTALDVVRDGNAHAMARSGRGADLIALDIFHAFQEQHLIALWVHYFQTITDLKAVFYDHFRQARRCVVAHDIAHVLAAVRFRMAA